jgi:hypothetical protein
MSRVAGRPFAPAVAWAVLAVQAGLEPHGPAWVRHRARSYAARPLADLAERLGNRATANVSQALPAVRSDLLADPRLVLTGVSAASAYGSLLDDPAAVDAYVKVGQIDDVAGDYALLPDGNGRVILRAVNDDVWPFTDERCAWRPVVALDLLTDSSSDRARNEGEKLL